MKSNLLTYTLQSRKERFSDSSKTVRLARIYICAENIREMAALLREHLPDEYLPPCEIAASAARSWPETMRFVKKEKGLWVSKFSVSPFCYRVIKETLTEVD